MANVEALSLLRRVPIFAGLSDESLGKLVDGSRLRSYPAGQVIWSEGDPGDALLILVSGQLRISRIESDGRESVLSVVEPPAAIGELALLDNQPRDATVVAQRDVSVRLLPRQAFRELLATQPTAIYGLLKTLAAMVRSSNERYARAIGLDVPGRVAAWLLDRAVRSGLQVSGATPITIPLGRSQGELAAEIGATRSTLNRALKELERGRLIEMDGDTVVLLDPDALSRRVE
jgi:CRP-like cAMP-binding protein